jgi:hypothetical protein
MNRIEFGKLSSNDLLNNGHRKWYWRQKANKILGYKHRAGLVIHHLCETEEQREFNLNYYERWGIDFDGQMKYCILMTVKEHKSYHSKNFKNYTNFLKGKTKETCELYKKLSEIHTSNLYNLGKKRSEESKKNISEAHKGIKYENRKKPPVFTEEHRKNLTNSAIKKYANGYQMPEKSRESSSKKQKGIPKSEDSKRKMSLAKMGMHWKLENGKRIWFKETK